MTARNPNRISSPKAHDQAVYNSRIADMSDLPLRCARLVSPLLILLFAVTQLWAADWHSAEEQLSGKIAAVTGPGTIALEVVNRSSLAGAEAERIRRELGSMLANLGIHVVNAEQAAATVKVSLSEDLQNYVWVAEIHQSANESSVVLVSTPRPEAAATASSATMSIHKTLLWSQPGRILDVAVISGTPQHMIVLDADSVALYKFQDNRWQQEQSLPVAHMHPWPRDLRGRLILRQDHLFDAYLPGVFCRSTTSATVALNCYESDDPWPLSTGQAGLNAFFASTRNFFTGALAPGIGRKTTAPAFYSAAPLPRDKYTLWLFAAIDGQVHMLDGITDQIAGKLGWGSDLASVHSNCGSGWQVLAAAPGDGPKDTVRVFELPDREPIAVSEPAEFNGSLTALWMESDGSGVIAIAQNRDMGKYEAYRLSIACDQ